MHARRITGLLAALALAGLSFLVTAQPAVAEDGCGAPVSSGGYSVTACSAYASDSTAIGFVYVTLPAGHAACTIHAKQIYVDNSPVGFAQDWPCPAGAVTGARYDIDFVPNGETITRGSIRTSTGATIVGATSIGA